MSNPVFGCIVRKRDISGIFLVNLIVQTEYNAQAGLSEDRVCRLGKDVIAGNVSACVCESIRC